MVGSAETSLIATLLSLKEVSLKKLNPTSFLKDDEKICHTHLPCNNHMHCTCMLLSFTPKVRNMLVARTVSVKGVVIAGKMLKIFSSYLPWWEGRECRISHEGPALPLHVSCLKGLFLTSRKK